MNFTTLLKFGEHITPDSPIGDRVSIGLQVVGIGMGVVFGVLLVLIGILQIFKLFNKKQNSDNKSTEVSAPVAPVAAPATSVANVPASEEETIVAVATVAIAASRGKSNVDFNVISIAPIGCGSAQAAPSVSAPASTTAPEVAPKKNDVSTASSANVTADGEKVTAPLPGNVLDVKVSKGDSVKKGDILCILEAMKMENEIVAPVDGAIVSVNATKGSSVNTGDLLFVIA